MSKRKKKRYRLKPQVKLFLIILILIIVLIIFKNNTNKKEEIHDNLIDKKSYLGTFNDETGSLSNSDKELITDYMNLYYKSMIDLKARDPRNLFLDKDGPEAYLTYNALDLLVKHHKMQNSDMTLKKAKYDIKVTDVDDDTDGKKITYRETDTLRFKYLDVDSKGIDIENTMVIKNGKIVSLRVMKDFYVMFTNSLNTITKSGVDELKSKYLKEMQDEKDNNDKLMDYAFKHKYKDKKNCSIKYDRDKAVEYSYKYLDKRNPKYTAFDDVGGNCMNLVSQSMHEAGLPMDLDGPDVWKYFGPTQDDTTSRQGRSSSWTGTQTFHTYAVNNQSGGLCLDPDVNLFYAEKGDVGQVGFDDSFNHSVIIVKVIKDENGKPVDFLLNCNTTTFENYPLLAYVYPDKRIIKVLGSN